MYTTPGLSVAKVDLHICIQVFQIVVLIYLLVERLQLHILA